ncbi:MAG: flagellar protein FlaG [Deltaproteobacteria bacterium]|nr:flagellar protein FlaG [Deltaproteobacteria bacterium]
MKVELTSPNILPAVPNREPAAKKLQAEDINHNAAREPEKKTNLDDNVRTAKKIDLVPGQTHLKFETDKETGIHLIKIVDAESGEVMLQIPAEELLKISKSLQNFKGLLVSKES